MCWRLTNLPAERVAFIVLSDFFQNWTARSKIIYIYIYGYLYTHKWKGSTSHSSKREFWDSVQLQPCQQQSFCLANIVSVLHQTRLAFKKQSKHPLYQNYSVSRKAVKIQIQIINQRIMLKCNPLSTLHTLFIWFQTKIPLRVAPAFGSVHSGRNPGDREGAWTSDPGQQWQMQHWWGGVPAYIWPVVYNWK